MAEFPVPDEIAHRLRWEAMYRGQLMANKATWQNKAGLAVWTLGVIQGLLDSDVDRLDERLTGLLAARASVERTLGLYPVERPGEYSPPAKGVNYSIQASADWKDTWPDPDARPTY